MTTLYKPVKITTTEQANALPAGTIALDPDPLHACADAPRICIESGLWSSNGYFNEREMIGWTALVPIEAEVETRHGLVGLIDPTAPHDERRLVTPWEAV